MDNTKVVGRGTVIFREGDPGDCMYELENGAVGIYHDYGGPDEKLISTLYSGGKSLKVFGEMGLLEHAPRSATVVATEDNTMLTRISAEDFSAYLSKNPVNMLNLLQQMCNRLRATTNDYVKACHTVHDMVEAEKDGEAKSQSLLDEVNQLCDFYAAYHTFF